MVKVLLVAYNLFFFLLFTDSTASVTTGTEQGCEVRRRNHLE